MARLKAIIKSLVGMLLIFLPAITFADLGGYTIDYYNVFIKINPNGVVDFHEQIGVHFTEERHGIYRKIPYDRFVLTEINSQMTNVLKILHIHKITSDHPHMISIAGDYISIRLGSPNKTIIGKEEYNIYYSIDNLLILDNKNYDEFYWNAIGTDWNTQIGNPYLEITFPNNLKDLENFDYRIYYGYAGTTDGGQSGREVEGKIVGKKLIYKHPYTLEANQGITIQARIPKGIITLSLMSKIKFFWREYFHFILTGAILVFSFLVWLKWGRDLKVHIMTEFMPPKDISPSDASSILSQDAQLDITATIVDLARRGYLIIGQGDTGEVYLEKIKELDHELREFERMLVQKLFASKYLDSKNKNRVYTEKLKNTFYKDAYEVEWQFKSEFNGHKFFEETGDNWSAIYGFLALLLFIFLCLIAFFKLFIEWPKVVFIILIAMINSIIYAFIMPKKTVKGLKYYKHVKGFREFMSRAEKDRIARLSKEFPSYFDDTIPYAVVFGMADKWGKMFDDIIKEPPNWYHYYPGYSGGFRTSSFTDNLTTSMHHLNTAAYSSPQSSDGGSFGGGSSGGGFGGGGGGSW